MTAISSPANSSSYPVHGWLPDAMAGLPLYLGPNDGGIRRGEGDESGDNEARPTEKGSGPAQPTFDPSSFGGESSIGHPSGGGFDLEEERTDSDGIEIMEATDGRLGLTNVGDTPADDWAADTGETKTPDGTR
jgi:hypothetical protein